VIGAGNGGAEATTAEVTLFYNGGKSTYRTETMLSPGQQLWLDVGHLVRDQVPDSDGHTLPVSTMTGSYELRDLDHQLVGQLFEGKLVIDKTYGHASYGCGGCCGYTVPYIDPNPFDGPPDEDSDDYIYSTENCGGGLEDVTDGGFDWGSSNTAVAILPNRTLQTVAVGTATGSAEIELEFDNPKLECPDEDFNPQQPVNVGQTVYLVQTDCNTQPNADWSAGWGNPQNMLQCGLSQAGPPLPSGGSCIQDGTTAANTPRTCYQVNKNNCSITYCPGSTRIVNAACTQFLDQFPVVTTTVPAGCTQ
jgi:hypothetical protein